MGRFLRGFLLVFVSLVLVLAILAGVAGPRLARSSFPVENGEVRLAGLQAPVDILRDAYGIPHIYAANQHDLFFAQGYVHAQDRFWQMDFWRHIGSARLSEMFGESQLDTDRFLRTLGLARVVQQELDQMDPDSKEILQSYADGVNAYLADHKGSALSLEYAVLGLLNRGYQAEPWQPLHTLTWAKMMAWDLRGNLDEEIERAILLKTLTPEQVAEAMPPFPADAPVIVPNPSTSGALPAHSASRGGFTGPALAALEEAARRTSALSTLLGKSGPGIGSNNWVIAGARTATGKPLLANDPHLSEQMPSIWYEIGLHCVPKGPQCPYDVRGFSFASAPGIIIGHNDRIAWGLTNVGPDVQDLYIEKINPDNPNQYEFNGRWEDMTVYEETLQVSGGDPVSLTVRLTRHGPLITDTYSDLDQLAETGGLALPAQYAIALRWTALEPSYTFRAIWKLDRAQNWADFQDALREFSVPSQNFIYADVDGNIGYHTPGNIPIRPAGDDGTLPVPGWDGQHEWQGYIPFDELPSTYNPPQNYIATANNAVVGPDYPYIITKDWDYGYRARRIVEMIENAPGPIDIAYMQQMQGDNKNLIAEILTPILLQTPLNDARLEETRRLLEGWDYQNGMDSAPAALFAAFWKNLLANTYHDDLPEDYWPIGDSQSFEVVRNLLDQPGSPWWDNRSTPEVEGRDEILRLSFRDAVAELEKLLGKDPAKWKWGDLHTTTFHNQSLGQSGVGPIEALFNRGPFPTAGGGSIVNATSWDASSNTYEVRWLPSLRMIVDLGNLESSLSIHTTGQSGHAYHPHYADFADPWRNIQYHPMLWERAVVEESVEGRLRLVP